MIYFDTSAFVKLIWTERDSPALRAFLDQHAGTRQVSSSLLVVEARRTVLRQDPSRLPHADLLLTRIGQVGVTYAVLEAASRMPGPSLRSLDAIHLATALRLRAKLVALVTYDKRLAAAAVNQGIPVATPV